MVEGEPPYGAMQRALPGFFAQITVDGRFLYLNRLAPGYTIEQIRGATIFEFTLPQYHDAMRAALERAATTQLETGFPSMGEGAHGKLAPYYTLISPIVENDRVTSLVLLATDVSHVVDAHRALEFSDAKLRLALEATGMGIWSYDPARKEVTWDATIAKIFGYPAEPRTRGAVDHLEHIHPDDQALVRTEMERMHQTGFYGPIEYRIVRTDGATRWLSATGRLQHADASHSSRLVGGVIDITARKLQDERFAQAQKLDSIGRLAGGVAHDFNNMLTAILGYADMCIASVQPGTAIIEDLREIKAAAERSRELTSRLLMFARKQRVEYRVVDPNVLVQDIDRLLRRIVGEDIVVRSTLHATRNVRVDPHQIEQLLLNLATNARDAMPRGGRLVIETSNLDVTEPDGDLSAGAHVRIRVVDTGSGIPQELLPHIFEPFFTTKESDKGTGLGLAQCYGIARQHAGQLRVTSQVGIGTQVTLELPAIAEVMTHERASMDAGIVASPARAATILLVEDESLIRSLLARVLRDQGYHVLDAADGTAALALAAAHPHDIHLLLTDMVMPGMTGLELATTLRQLRPTLAVVVMSGYAPELVGGDRAISVLPKPFRPHELLAKVSAVLG